jgi:hypothetical protein
MKNNNIVWFGKLNPNAIIRHKYNGQYPIIGSVPNKNAEMLLDKMIINKNIKKLTLPQIASRVEEYQKNIITAKKKKI